jgi:type I restriction enzyme S subunit
MPNWKEYKLGEIAELRRESFIPDSSMILPYIGLEHIEPAGLRLNSIGRSSDVTSQKAKFYPNDILYGKLRPYFKKVYSAKFEGVCSTDIYVLKAKKGINPKYLFYLVATDEFTTLANSGSTGTRMPRADWKHLSKTIWNLPDLPAQTAIAEILSSLDDKIELNNQVNKELEALAQALFKQWFIDFEFPNEKGQPYKSSSGEMVESELGKIPKGWEIQTISDVCRVINGRAYKNTEFELTGTPIIRIQNLNGGTNYVYSNLKLDDDKYVNRDELIFAWSATFGPFIWRGNRSIYHYHIWKLECFDSDYKYFLYHHLNRESSSVSNLGTGSIFTHITKSLMESQRLLKPSKDIVSQFHEQVSLLDSKISNLIDETNALIALRNTLLPKLISGELTVKDV